MAGIGSHVGAAWARCGLAATPLPVRGRTTDVDRRVGAARARAFMCSAASPNLELGSLTSADGLETQDVAKVVDRDRRSTGWNGPTGLLRVPWAGVRRPADDRHERQDGARSEDHRRQSRPNCSPRTTTATGWCCPDRYRWRRWGGHGMPLSVRPRVGRCRVRIRHRPGCAPPG
jgi:hypothetical protein